MEERKAESFQEKRSQILQAVFEASPLAIVVFDPSGVVQVWNPGATSMFGWSAEEAVGHFCPLVPEGEEDRFVAHIEAQVKGTQLKGTELRRRRKDSALLEVRLWTAPVRDENGKICGVVAIYVDDNERKQALEELIRAHAELEIRVQERTQELRSANAALEQEISEHIEAEAGKKQAQEQREQLFRAVDEQRRLFQMLVEHSPSGIAILDGTNLRIKWTNPKYRQLMDEPYRNMDLTGMRLQDFMPPHTEIDGMEDAFRQAAASGQPHVDSEYKLRGFARGETYWRRVILPLSSVAGGTPDLMVLLTDLTEEVTARKKIEELAAQLSEERRALQLRNLEVERASRLKSEFLAGMSHELRTPLHSIIGFSELLAEESSGELNKKQKSQLDHILRGARHLLSLINDILDLSKIEAGRMEINPESFTAGPVVLEVLNTIAPMAAAKRIQTCDEVDPSLVLWADRLRFKQILSNLLSNAVKFTPEGGRISISAALQNDWVELSVSDTGVGIPATEQEAIFDEFHQASTTTKGIREGTGLGLAITRRLVKAHGGEIRVESEVGRGSRFTVRLPLRSQAHRIDQRAGALHDQRWLRGVTGYQESPRAKTILAADDNAESREFIKDSLASLDFVVTEACDGREALAKIRNFRPDLVVMDIQMPVMDGYSVLREMRQDVSISDIPVVALTAFAMEGDREKALAAGFNSYLSKPIDPASLRNEVEHLLRK